MCSLPNIVAAMIGAVLGVPLGSVITPLLSRDAIRAERHAAHNAALRALIAELRLNAEVIRDAARAGELHARALLQRLALDQTLPSLNTLPPDNRAQIGTLHTDLLHFHSFVETRLAMWLQRGHPPSGAEAPLRRLTETLTGGDDVFAWSAVQ